MTDLIQKYKCQKELGLMLEEAIKESWWHPIRKIQKILKAVQFEERYKKCYPEEEV